jgi:hypothetical protein
VAHHAGGKVTRVGAVNGRARQAVLAATTRAACGGTQSGRLRRHCVSSRTRNTDVRERREAGGIRFHGDHSAEHPESAAERVPLDAGEFSCAPIAGPLSPLNPAVPVPAKVEIVP